METKEYYRAFMAVIEYVSSGSREIPCSEGERLAGEYWPRIFRAMQREHIGTGSGGGDFFISQPQYLTPIYADCTHAIREIEKMEEDRALDNLAKETDMKYARKAYWISLAALTVAASSLAWQVITRLTT